MTDQTPDLCPTCGIDLDYPTGPHILDCPAPAAAPPLNGMTDQTPSTEDVLDAVTEYGKQCVDAVESFRCATPDLEDVRNALAARDREVAAQALRDAAASARDNELNDDGTGYFNWLPKEWNLLASEWLLRRADRIGAGDDS